MRDRTNTLRTSLHAPAKGALGSLDLVAGGANRSPNIIRSKRIFDLLVTSLILFFLAPAFMLIAAAVLMDGGSVFYVHRRIGWRGRMFKCLKFRTMRMNTDVVLAATLQKDAELRSQWEAKQKLRHDPRVTRVGRVLRKTSLDELPQLFNVLLGDMSLVGPRPVVPEELQKFYSPAAACMYLSVRPGVTGLWQVSGRSDTNYTDRVALDCAYIANMSIANDLGLLVRTVGALIQRNGAY
jgi:undecaprenyl-phosphate galactose phosphotransferase